MSTTDIRTVTITSGEGDARTTRSYTYGSTMEARSQFYGWVAESIVFYRGDGACRGHVITWGHETFHVGRYSSGQLDLTLAVGGRVTQVFDRRAARALVAQHRPHLLNRRVA